MIIAEKGDVGRTIAKALKIPFHDNMYQNDRYIVTWSNGHLFELCDAEDYNPAFAKWNIEDLPIIPETYQYKINEPDAKYKVTPQERFDEIKKLMDRPDVSEIICATDAGREGQLIFMLIYHNAGCSKPVKRLWLASMTDSDIVKGFHSLKDNDEYEPLFYSALARSHADWLVGINMTRLLSSLNNTLLSVGRVQTPTLAMVVKRQNDIENFVSTPFYQIEGRFKNLPLLWKNEDGNRFDNKADAEAIISRIKGKEGIVTRLNVSKRGNKPPELYNLSALQIDASKKFGYTAQEVLNCAQQLYEKYKVTTYPRTSSNYLASSSQPDIPDLIDACSVFSESHSVIGDIKKSINYKNVIDDSKLSDHHAIIPTSQLATFDVSTLDPQCYNVLKLIVCRFLCALSQPAIYEVSDVQVTVDGETFERVFKEVQYSGWQSVFTTFFKRSVPPPVKIPFALGDKISECEYEILEKMTTPPEYYTDGSLIDAMRSIAKHVTNKAMKQYVSDGIGTEATRAGIIEKLISTGYIVRSKSKLLATDKGKLLIFIAPEYLKNPDLTAEWEERLFHIEHEDDDYTAFMDDINEFVTNAINTVLAAPDKYVVSSLASSSRKSVGVCPKCGQEVLQGKEYYYCESVKTATKCGFSVKIKHPFLAIYNKEVMPAMMQKLLISGNKVELKNLVSKKSGKKFNMFIELDLSGKYVGFKTSFKK